MRTKNRRHYKNTEVMSLLNLLGQANRTVMMVVMFVISIASPFAHAKVVKFQYSIPMCACEATVDDKKVNPEEAKRAIEFLIRGVSMSRTASFENTNAPPDVDELIKKVEEMRLQNLARIPENMLGIPAWKSERPKFIFEAELQAYLDRSNLEYRKTRDIKVLLKPLVGKPIPKECEKFAQALPTAATLLPMGEELAKSQCAGNRDENLCKQKFLASPNDPNSVDELRAQVLNFGWHNCVNKQRDTLKSVSLLRAAIEEKFLKNKCKCEK